MRHIFTYGSLMFAEVWTAVVRGDYARSRAVLAGFERKSVVGELYPVIVPAQVDRLVTGILYLEVSDDDISRLDLFEGRYYDRQRHQVILPDDRHTAAEVYVVRPAFRHVVSDADWDPEYFQAVGISVFLQEYGGFTHSDR